MLVKHSIVALFLFVSVWNFADANNDKLKHIAHDTLMSEKKCAEERYKELWVCKLLTKGKNEVDNILKHHGHLFAGIGETNKPTEHKITSQGQHQQGTKLISKFENAKRRAINVRSSNTRQATLATARQKRSTTYYNPCFAHGLLTPITWAYGAFDGVQYELVNLLGQGLYQSFYVEQCSSSFTGMACLPLEVIYETLVFTSDGSVGVKLVKIPAVCALHLAA